MSNHELLIAVATVRFDQESITGNQLMALTQQVAEQGKYGTSFVVERRYYDGDVMTFGQKGHPADHVRVTPSLDGLPFIAPANTYSEVKVTNHLWRGGSDFTVSYSQQLVIIIKAVRKFADELRAAYETALNGGFPEYVEPESTRNNR